MHIMRGDGDNEPSLRVQFINQNEEAFTVIGIYIRINENKNLLLSCTLRLNKIRN